MNTRWQQAGQKVKPGFKLAGKLVLLTALRYGPAVHEWCNDLDAVSTVSSVKL